MLNGVWYWVDFMFMLFYGDGCVIGVEIVYFDDGVFFFYVNKNCDLNEFVVNIVGLFILCNVDVVGVFCDVVICLGVGLIWVFEDVFGLGMVLFFDGVGCLLVMCGVDCVVMMIFFEDLSCIFVKLIWYGVDFFIGGMYDVDVFFVMDVYEFMYIYYKNFG